jgi:deoxyribodipyrimidine photolyase-like uncharacterized protein
MSSPIKINHIIKDLIEKYHLTKDFMEYQSMQLFREKIGEEGVQNIEYIKISQKILIVKFKSPSIKNDLTYQRNKILDEINSDLGQKVINNIVIM